MGWPELLLAWLYAFYVAAVIIAIAIAALNPVGANAIVIAVSASHFVVGLLFGMWMVCTNQWDKIKARFDAWSDDRDTKRAAWLNWVVQLPFVLVLILAATDDDPTPNDVYVLGVIALLANMACLWSNWRLL